MVTRLFHISDVHFGAEDKAALAEVARAVHDEPPDAVICTGDLTQRAKRAEYAIAAKWFADLGVPVLVEPGNHDMPYYNLFERFTAPYRRFRDLKNEIGSAVETQDVVCVSLKTTVRAQRRFPWSDGVVTDSALRETLDQLSELEGDKRHVVVTAHHPLLGQSDEIANPTIGGDRAFGAIAAAGADVILTGHVHAPFDEERERNGHKLRMIGAGTLSTRLRHGAPPSYRTICATRGGSLTSELRELQSSLV